MEIWDGIMVMAMAMVMWIHSYFFFVVRYIFAPKWEYGEARRGDRWRAGHMRIMNQQKRNSVREKRIIETDEWRGEEKKNEISLNMKSRFGVICEKRWVCYCYCYCYVMWISHDMKCFSRFSLFFFLFSIFRFYWWWSGDFDIFARWIAFHFIFYHICVRCVFQSSVCRCVWVECVLCVIRCSVFFISCVHCLSFGRCLLR